VRVDLGAIGGTILSDLAGLGVELANVTAGDRREPNIPLFVGDQSVRTRVGRLQRIFLKFSSLRIEPNLFAACPVYHSEPSGASAGSCGRDFGVGTSYSRICTLSIPTVVEPARVAASVNKHSLGKDMDVLLRRKL
jgi:hypothetical protein